MTQPMPSLTWRRAKPDCDRAIVSTCGRFSIARVTVNGADRFEVFQLQRSGQWQRLRATAVTGGGARSIAELAAGDQGPQGSIL